MNVPPTAQLQAPAPRAALLPPVSGEYFRAMILLKNDWAQLRENRASVGLGFPIASLVVGALFLSVGAVNINSVYAESYNVAFAQLAIGAIATLIGGGSLSLQIVRKVGYSRDIEEVERRMRFLRADGSAG